MNEVVLRCKVLGIDFRTGHVSLEVRALDMAPAVVVLSPGQNFQWSANISDPPIVDVSGAALVLEKARRASPPEAAPQGEAPKP